MARLQKQNDSRRKLLEDELQWVRTNPSGRHAKSQARLKRYEELAAQQVDTREEELRIRIPAGPRLGDLVVRARDLKMGFGDKLLFENLSFDLPRGGIVGVIGGNGAGKTTLFKLMTGKESRLAARSRSAPRSRSPTSTSCATRSTPTRPSTRRSREATSSSRSPSPS